MTAFDVYPPATNRLAADSANTAQSPYEVVSDMEILVSTVANSLQARPLLSDPETGAVQ